MEIRLIREPTIDGVTMGVLFLDGHYQCFALEDQLREQPGQPVSAWKIPKQTAIPAGRYRVVLTPSVRFQRPLPLLVDVPGFTGVRIHSGNTVSDTEGCILVGKDRQEGRILQSRIALDLLYNKLVIAPGDLWIDVLNPLMAKAA